jgi:TonB-dependent starch-binding outer membrane protein SusC
MMKQTTNSKKLFSVNSQLKKNFFFIMVLLLQALLVSEGVFAQNKTVKGRIVDDGGKPVQKATVLIKGSTSGTSTDDNGDFQISVPEKGTLVISAVDFTTQEIKPGDKTTLNVTLVAFSKNLSEVVVVGYGTQRKKDLTGSVASVNIEALRESPNTNIGQLLQGTVPGLNVGLSTFAGGTPPISIRGINTISGNRNVLIILDGIQYNQSLSSINPDDIASIDILKDASSTAVYGAQAANGVILITTRKGRNNPRPRITFSSSYSTQTPNVDLRPRNRQEYLDAIKEAYYNVAYTGPDYTTPVANFNIGSYVDNTMRVPGSNPAQPLPNDFNWWEEGTKVGQIREINLGVSGGSDRFNYLLSGGIVDQKGFIINDIFKRKSIRANLEIKPLQWWKVGLVSSGSFVNQDGAEPGVGLLNIMSPLQTPFDSIGKLIPFPTATLVPNPYNTYYVENYDRNNYYFANIYSDIDFPFLKELNYRMNFGNNYRTTNRYGSSVYAANQTGEAYKNYENYYDYTFDNILTYTKNFGKHGITATLLYGAIERQFNSAGSRATGFTRLSLGYNNIGLGTNQFVSSNATKEALNYQMARVNYKFNERYLLTATIRRDGFSGFARNFKYANFPSVGLGWILSEESFMKNVKPVDFLKLRITYGVSGNQTGQYSSIARVSTTPWVPNPPNPPNFAFPYVFGDGGTTAAAQQVTSLGNPDLKWERTKGLNLATDFTFLNNRLSGTFDYYISNTFDLLYSINIPLISGFGSIQTNVGQLRNMGFEAALTYNVINKGDFTWSSMINFWRNRNKIISIAGVDANGDGREDDLVGSNLFIGRTLNTIYYYQNAGIYQLKDVPLPGFFAGSMRLVDQDKNGTITAGDDRVFIGDQNPVYRFSWMNTFNYKGFSLMLFINSVQGGKNGYLGNNTRVFFRDDNSIRNNDLIQVDYWSPTNPNGKYPRIISGTNPTIQPQYWESRSFIRLQDASLSYNFGKLIKKAKIQAVNLYISGKNLITWTNWEGWDPEALINVNGVDVVQGLVTDARPVLRTFTVGLNITY